MSFTRLILVFCIIYAICSIIYKRYKRKKQHANLGGPGFLKSLGETVCGVIFENNTGKTLNLKLEIIKTEKIIWSEYLKLAPEGGKLPFFTPTHLKISLSDENTLSVVLDKPHHEYRVVIDSDGVIRSKQE